MNKKTLAKINHFGTIGKIVTMILFVAAIIGTALIGGSAAYVATLPKDAVTVTVTNHAKFNINDDNFRSMWNMLASGVAQSTSKDPSTAISNGTASIPEENTKFDTKLNFFNQSYSSATIHSEKGRKIVTAESSPAEYRSSNLVAVLACGALLLASIAVALLMLERLFKVLSVCESPFCNDFVRKLRTFGYALLPVAVLTGITDTLATRFMSAGQNAGISIPWGMLIAFVVTMCLVVVFRYGVQLQKESDETL